MAAAGEIEETVSSGSETKSGNKAYSGAKSRDETGVGERANPAHDANLAAAGKTVGAGSAPSSSLSEPPKAGADGEPSLGKTLAATRERRGISRADVVSQTRIPTHYIEMIESSDYGLISDQLYVLPFLRRYAAFLNLDGEEIAMRFVREVQRAEGAAVPRMSEPLAVHDHKNVRWGRRALVMVVLSVIVVLYVIASRRHSGEGGFHPLAPSAPPTAPSIAMPPAALAPAPPAALAPLTAPALQAEPAPQAAALPPLPETAVVGAPASAIEPGKTPSDSATAPANNATGNNNE
jgi:cytoskeletal protein RodZ